MHDSTDFTPYELLVCGREAHRPVDMDARVASNCDNQYLSGDNGDDCSHNQPEKEKGEVFERKAERLTDILKEVHATAKDNIENSQGKQKKYFDQRNKPPRFEA